MRDEDISSNSGVYIIGDLTNPNSIRTRIKFNVHQRILESFGYKVINPLKSLKNIHLKTDYEYNKYFLKKLIDCNAVYVMSDISINKGENIELKISIDLGLLIIHDLIPDFNLKDLICESDMEPFLI